jgi:putative glutamine amidotransferase
LDSTSALFQESSPFSPASSLFSGVKIRTRHPESGSSRIEGFRGVSFKPSPRDSSTSLGMTAISGMRNIATWMRRSDEKYFAPFFAKYPDIEVRNAARLDVPFEQMDGLLLTGGPDVAPEFLNQPVPDPSVIEKDVNPDRDRWELDTIKKAIESGLPIFAICKGLQTLNVALGGTLHLDITGHNLPDQKTHDVQPLRSDRKTRHRFGKVNSSHHQAINKLGAGLEVESWCATDDIVEQVKLRDYPFALGVQYHPERGKIYDELFDDFVSRVRDLKSLNS